MRSVCAERLTLSNQRLTAHAARDAEQAEDQSNSLYERERRKNTKKVLVQLNQLFVAAI
jgi:hypothetical protein